MAEDPASRWNICKIIEERENGELILLEENLKQLLHTVKPKKHNSGSPIGIVTFLGSPTSGNAFFTNLLAAWSKSNGPAWANRIKTHGLEGFAMRLQDDVTTISDYPNHATMPKPKDEGLQKNSNDCHENLQENFKISKQDEHETPTTPAPKIQLSEVNSNREEEMVTGFTEERNNDEVANYKQIANIILELGNKTEPHDIDVPPESKKAIEMLLKGARMLNQVAHYDNEATPVVKREEDVVAVDNEICSGLVRAKSESLEALNNLDKAGNATHEEGFVVIDIEHDETRNGENQQDNGDTCMLEKADQTTENVRQTEDIDYQENCSAGAFIRSDSSSHNSSFDSDNDTNGSLAENEENVHKEVADAKIQCNMDNIRENWNIPVENDNSSQTNRNPEGYEKCGAISNTEADNRSSEAEGTNTLRDIHDLSIISGENGRKKVSPRSCNGSKDIKLENDIDNVTEENSQNSNNDPGSHTCSLEDPMKKLPQQVTLNQANINPPINDMSQRNHQNSDSRVLNMDASPNGLKNGIFYPDEAISGIYCWPEFIQLHHNDNKLLWILYAHQSGANAGNKELESTLNMLLGLLCSVLVEVQWEENSAVQFLQGIASTDKYSSIKEYLCQHTIQIRKPETNHDKVNVEEDKRSNFQAQSFNLFVDLNNTTSENGAKQIPLTTKECRNIESFSKAITDEDFLKPRELDESRMPVSTSTLLTFLQSNISKINVANGVGNASQYSIKSLPETPSMTQKLIKPDIPEYPMSLRSSRSTRETNKNTIPTPNIRGKRISSPSIIAPLPSKMTTPKPNKLIPGRMNMNVNGPLTRSKVSEVDDTALKLVENTMQSEWSSLENHLRNWIETDMTQTNIKQINEVYNDWLQHSIEKKGQSLRKSKTVSPEVATRFAEKYTKKAEQIYRPIIIEIQDHIIQFCNKVNALFNTSTSYSQSQFKNTTDQIMSETLKQVKRFESQECIEEACKTLLKIYLVDNAKREEISCRISDASIKAIRECYQQHFDTQLLTKPYDPHTLPKSHTKLVTELVNVFTESFGESDNMSIQTEELRDELFNDLNGIIFQNSSKLETTMLQINNAIKSCKVEYESRMDVLLRDNLNGVEAAQFDMIHRKTLVECIKLLQNAVVKISKDEPIKSHVSVLEQHIEKAYKAMKTENEAALEEHASTAPCITKNGFEGNFNGNTNGVYGNHDDQYALATIQKHIEEQEPQQPSAQTQALIFQFSLPKIGVATILQGSQNMEPENMNFYTAALALLENDEWIFGDNASKLSHKLKKVKSVWNIQSCWDINDWRDNIILNGQYTSIKVEFLLATFFTCLAEKYEMNSTGNINEVLIAVPYWFSSLERQRVLDAACISGFTNVRLVNENSCSAYFMYATNQHTPDYDTVVISENSLKVDISLYSFDMSSSALSMLGHCGDYETKDVLKGSSRLYKFVTGILSYFVSHSQEKGVEEEALLNLEKLWQLALTRAEIQCPGSKLRTRKVLLCCESESWRDLLWKLALKVTSKDFISVRSDTVLHGLSALYHSPIFQITKPIRHLITDRPTLKVVLLPQASKSPIATTEKLCSGKVTLENPILECDLQTKETTYFIHELNSGLNVKIGKLIVKNLPKKYTTVTAILERSPDGILVLDKIQCTINYWVRGSNIEFLPTDNYTWETFNLDYIEVGTFKSVVDQIGVKMRTLDKIRKELQGIIEQGEKIKKAIDKGRGKFISVFAKNDALELIDSALTSLRHSNIEQIVLKKQETLFVEIASKHKI